jgi:hypothetical protein
MKNGGHLTTEGLREIVSIKASLNNLLTPTLKAAFPDIVPFVRPVMELSTTNVIYDPQWIVGFVTGDGSFSASSNNTTRKAFRVRFMVTQHARDLNSLEAIKNYFGGIGSISKNGGAFNYEVGSYKDCYNIILPFFVEQTIPSISIKTHNFEI